MTQPKIEGPKYGKPIMPYGSDGTNWIAFLIDALGHLQVDVVSAALGSGGATEATLLLLLTELLAKLETGDLSLEAVTKYLNVVVKTCALPTGAATETTLLLIKDYVDALETLLAGGLPAALDTGALKTKEQSPLTGFATSANQTTMITALQLIDDLRNALGSVATDKILVASKSGDKLFGFESIVEEAVENSNLAAGNNYLDGTPVPAGKVWEITVAEILYLGTAPTLIGVSVPGLAIGISIFRQPSPVSNQSYIWNGSIFLQAGDYMRAYVEGATLYDDLYFKYAGIQMNAP